MSEDKENNSQSSNKDFGGQIYGGSISGQTGVGRNINTGGGNYNEKIEGDYVQGNKGDTINQSGTFGIGINKGNIESGAKVAGVINEGQKQKLAEAAAEIQQLLQQLQQDNPSNNTSSQMMVAAQAIQHIESNPSLKQKVISAVKEGGLASFERALDNPAGAFVVGAIRGWQEVEQ